MSTSSSAGTRRTFLNSSSAAAAAFTILSPQVVRGSQANSKVTVGLIGSGGRGSYDASIVHADPRGQITAVCDLFDDRIESAKAKIKAPGAKVYKDYQKLLASEVDAVIIATPPFLHPEQLEAAVEAGKHIYCEKPMGVDATGCERIIKASKKHNPKKALSVGFQQRYGPVYLEAYKRLQNGDLGEIVTARAYWISGDPFKFTNYGMDAQTEKLRNWFAYREYSGDFIVEQDCHNFDVLHWFLGARPISAMGYIGRKVRTNMDINDNLTLSFRFPKEIHVNFEANQVTPRGYSKIGEEFTGTKGTVLTSRSKMVHVKGPNDVETIESKRDITNEAFEQWLSRIQNGNPENVGERSAISTLFAILGRTALYNGKEATWKGEFGNL